MPGVWADNAIGCQINLLLKLYYCIFCLWAEDPIDGDNGKAEGPIQVVLKPYDSAACTAFTDRWRIGQRGMGGALLS